MTDHVRRKHDFSDAVGDEEARRTLIARCAVDDTDKQILHLRYIKHNDFGFIADTLGLSYSAVIRRHAKALRVLQGIVNDRIQKI
jgi:DNA-directed RNA polymerase specialized sigma subunit